MKWIVGLLVLFAPYAAHAQLHNTDLSTTVGTSSASCIAANTGRKTLYLENPSGNPNTVGFCNGSGCTAVIGAAGTTVLPPGTTVFWPLYTAPVEQLNCIASGSSTPLTARSQK